MNRRKYVKSLIAYMESLGAVDVTFGHGGKHPFLECRWKGQAKKIVIPSTPGDSARGEKNTRRDIRRVFGIIAADTAIRV